MTSQSMFALCVTRNRANAQWVYSKLELLFWLYLYRLVDGWLFHFFLPKYLCSKLLNKIGAEIEDHGIVATE